MQIAKYVEIKTAAGIRAAFLSPKSDGLKECFPDVRLNGESTLEFMLPANSEKLDELTPECVILAGGREYGLLKENAIDAEMSDDGKLWAKIMTEETWGKLDYFYAETPINNDPGIPNPSTLAVIIVSGGSNLSGGLYAVGSAGHALYALLQGTNWSVGTVDVAGTHDLETEKESILVNIRQVQQTWGGYLVWDSINKTVGLRDETLWQTYTGFQIRYAKNMKNITRTQSNKLISRMYPFGKEDLDIAAVNGGLKYLDNHSYTAAHHVGIYKNEDVADAAELKDYATKALATECQPKYTYRAKIADLRTLPEYSHEDFAIGDMADVIQTQLGFNDKVRILRHKYNLFMPWKCDLELGNPENRFVEKLAASFSTSDYINGILNSKGQLPGFKLVDESIIAAKIASAAVDATKFNTKQMILTLDTWTNNSPSGGYVAWNAHKLYYAGTAYSISAGNTNKKYIVWRKDTSTTIYQKYTETEFAALTLADYDFTIAINNAGIHDIAWYNRLARQFIGSAFVADAAILEAHIANLAVTNAKIASLEANKITTAVAKIGVAQIDSLTVGTNVGIGTAQDSAGVTTIIGNTVTTGFVNVLGINARKITASDGTNKVEIDGAGDINFNRLLYGLDSSQVPSILLFPIPGIIKCKTIQGLDDGATYTPVSGKLVLGAVQDISCRYILAGLPDHSYGIMDLGYLTVLGSKNSLQKTVNYGDRLINAYETAEYYFGDIGSAIIGADGEVVINIDEIFQECVNTNITYHVFTQVYNGSISGIARQPGYFTVTGTPGTEFSWELKAKRLGYESDRMEVFDKGDEVIYSDIESELDNNLENILLEG